MVDSLRTSYYCSDRGNRIDGSEQQVIDKCNSDRLCTGYDYRKQSNYGYLCRQLQYPGSSVKCCGYKLCKRTGRYNTFVYKFIREGNFPFSRFFGKKMQYPK